jgi:hypothetical protein
MHVLPLSPARRSFALFILVGMLAALSIAPALAQSDTTSLPNDPSSAFSQSQATPPSSPDSQAQPSSQPSSPSSTSQNNSLEGKQTKRILGIVPNFRSVSVDQKLPPESVKDKFKESTQDALDYSDFVFVAILAGVDQAEGSYPEFHQGAVGYGRYYWHTLADQADEDYQVEFVFPALLHQDSRYYTLGRGGFAKRALYAFDRILITRTDNATETFNTSEIVGAGAAAGISDFYYPSQERTWTKTGQRWVLNVGLDGATFVFKEFWPDLNNKFFHQKN